MTTLAAQYKYTGALKTEDIHILYMTDDRTMSCIRKHIGVG